MIDNFSKIALISEQPIKFFIDNNIIIMKLPVIGDMFSDPLLQTGISILNIDIDKLQNQISYYKFDNIWSLLKVFIMNNSNNDIINSIRYLFNYCFGSQLIEKNGKWFLLNFIIDNEFFIRVSDIILISCGIKSWEDQEKFNKNKPDWILESERKIKRIKQQNNTKNQDEDQLLKACMQINYELGYKIEDILQMNYYHFKYIQKYIPKIVQYNLHMVATATGNSKKKLTYFTD